MAEPTSNRAENNSISNRWTVAALVILIILAAIYAISTSGKNYVKPMDSQSLPKAPEAIEKAQPDDQLHTQSSQDQPVSSISSKQLQTGSSSVQQAMPNSPQRAGSSSPSDFMYSMP